MPQPRLRTGTDVSSTMTTLRSLLPHGGSLPIEEWDRRHRVILFLLWLSLLVVFAYAAVAHGWGSARYLPEDISLVIFACIAGRPSVSRKWRSIAASLGLLTASALLVDISGGLIEMHFSFFVAVVILTLYEDWVPFLLAVVFVLLHHGIMGTLDPHAVFNRPADWANPWAWAALHAMFVALAGVAGVTAWRLNEQVRQRMRTTQDELQVAHDDLKVAHDELAALATTDPLTGLPNHRALISAIEQEIERSRRYGRTFTVLFLDLDHFKALNDTYGHHAGDGALRALGTLLGQRLRAVDTAGRWGGEEFLAILPETDEEAALVVAEAIREAVAGHAFGDTGVHLTCSLGIACYPANGADRISLVDAADRAMYAAKSLGRNQAFGASDPAVAALDGLNDHGSRDALALAGAVGALAMLVDVRDDYTGKHAADVSHLTCAVALEFGCAPAEAHMISVAGRLHDVGKVAVPDAILRKPGRLSEEEWKIMRTHPVVGAEVVSLIPALRGIAPVVRSHHERVDGSGYPDGLKGDEIPLGARIVAVADAFSAMTSDRPYRNATSPSAAIGELRRHAGTQFDPLVLAAFETVLDRRARETPQRVAGSSPRARSPDSQGIYAA
jgi:diguanylate cyclase (GGDEF)-like protein